MTVLSWFSNPVWRARNLILHIGEAQAPTLYVYDQDGFATAAPGHTMSAEEANWLAGYNSEWAALNYANQIGITGLMQYIFPLHDSLSYSPLSPTELTDLGKQMSWLSHEQGSEFYADWSNYEFSPNDPDREADWRLAAAKRLLAKAGLEVDLNEIEGKVQSGVASPIAIDLNGDGIKTISLFATGGVLFDIDGDGVEDRTAWLSGEDALLAIDKNGNGKIDDISELFGGKNRGEGFANLASYDSNLDGIVDQLDNKHSDLLLWTDANRNGITDEGELQNAATAGLQSISTSYTSQEVYENGNLLGEVATAVFQGRAVDAIDVYFRAKMTTDLSLPLAPSSASTQTAALIAAMAVFSPPAVGDSVGFSSNYMIKQEWMLASAA